jgi:hypothetical protein
MVVDEDDSCSVEPDGIADELADSDDRGADVALVGSDDS